MFPKNTGKKCLTNIKRYYVNFGILLTLSEKYNLFTVQNNYVLSENSAYLNKARLKFFIRGTMVVFFSSFLHLTTVINLIELT